MSGFYEDDEPLETIRRIRQRPPDLVTSPPLAVTLWLDWSPGGVLEQRTGPLTWCDGMVTLR